MSETGYVALDIGGTYIKYAVVKNDYSTLFEGKIDTPKELLATEFLCGIVDELLEKSHGKILIKGIAISSAGIIGDDYSVLSSNNIRFENPHFGKYINKRFGLATTVLNDANCAVLAEHRLGAGQGTQNMAMFTAGTGVGVGLILDGRLFKGGNSCAAGGHIITHGGGESCKCSGAGCLESYASITALIKYAESERQNNSGSKLWKYNILNGKNIFEAEKEGDIAAVSAVVRFVSELSYGIISILNLLRPERIVIGGGISAEGVYLTDKLAQYIKDKAFAPDALYPYTITTAKLGNSAGISGAVLYLRETIEKGDLL